MNIFERLDLTNKSALVCGGSQGIGFATARSLAGLGANIILLARDEEKLKKAVASIKSEKTDITCDYIVADMEQTKALQRLLEVRLKYNSIDILINNTGGPLSNDILDMSYEGIQKPMDRFLGATMILVNCLLPNMIKNKYGRIITVLSNTLNNPHSDYAVSITVRSALQGWLQVLSKSVVKHGITVNNVLPGIIKTEGLIELFTHQAKQKKITLNALLEQKIKNLPLGRFGKPEEVGDLIAFLSSPTASYINGVSIPVSG